MVEGIRSPSAATDYENLYPCGASPDANVISPDEPWSERINVLMMIYQSLVIPGSGGWYGFHLATALGLASCTTVSREVHAVARQCRRGGC